LLEQRGTTSPHMRCESPAPPVGRPESDRSGAGAGRMCDVAAAPPGDACGEAAPTAVGVAAALVEQSHRFREAVASRSEVLSAVERFYLDTLECQWRLEALEGMVAAVSTALGETPFLGEDGRRATSGGEPEPSPEDAHLLEQEWRRDAIGRCLLEIGAQQDRVTKALRERAEMYSTGVLASSGLIERLATEDGERERASERLTRLVSSIFSEIACEAEELAAASSLPEALPLFLPTLRRRQGFWQQQLREMWAAWESATAGMHEFGHDVVSAWIELSTAVRASRTCCGSAGSAGQRTLLLNALAEAAGQSLEVELLNSQGLAGLDAEAARAVASAPDGRSPSHIVGSVVEESLDAEDWSTMRMSMLRSVLQLLEKAGVLCDAELRTSPACFLQAPCC